MQSSERRAWHPIEIETQSLPDFIDESIRKGVFRPQQSDVHIQDLERKPDFRFCHESDLHFESYIHGLTQQVIDMLRIKGFKMFADRGPKLSALPKQWTPIDWASRAELRGIPSTRPCIQSLVELCGSMTAPQIWQIGSGSSILTGWSFL